MNKEQVTHLAIAKIVAPHGLRGEVKAEILTDFPERFRRLESVFVGDEPNLRRVVSTRLHKRSVFLQFEGCDTATEAEALRGQIVRVPISEAFPLPEDHYYWHQILGMDVWTVEDEHVGKIVDILERPANDVYVVDGPRGEVLIPAIEDVVIDIDVPDRKMVIKPIPGLLE